MPFWRPWTRAMPSPTSSTVPVLVTVSSGSYFSSCWRRTALISSGRMPIMEGSSPYLAQALAKRGQAAAHAAVDDLVPDLQDEPADQARIHLGVHFHVLGELAGQLDAQGVGDRGVERLGARDLDGRAAPQRVDALAVACLH